MIHYVHFQFKNGLLKILENIDFNENSTYFLHKIIPIRIVNNIVQINSSNCLKSQSFGVKDNYNISKFIKVPISFKDSPNYSTNWQVEIESNYLNLLENYQIYLNYPNIDSTLVDYNFSNNKAYLSFRNFPNINSIKSVYIQKKLTG